MALWIDSEAGTRGSSTRKCPTPRQQCRGQHHHCNNHCHMHLVSQYGRTLESIYIIIAMVEVSITILWDRKFRNWCMKP